MVYYACIRCSTCRDLTSLDDNDAPGRASCAKCSGTDLVIVPLAVPPEEYAGGGKVYTLEEWVKQTDPDAACECGHTAIQHIYAQGACRPNGIECPCTEFKEASA